MTTFNIIIEIPAIEGAGAYNTASQSVETRKFNTLKEARKELRRMVKSEGFQKVYNEWYNKEHGTSAFLRVLNVPK